MSVGKASSLWSPLGLACPCLGFHGLVSSCAGFPSLACGCLGFSCSCFACLVFSCHVLVCPKWPEKQTQHGPKLASCSVQNRPLEASWGPPGASWGPWAAPGPLRVRPRTAPGPLLGCSWGLLGPTWVQHGPNLGPTWLQNRGPGALKSALRSKLVSKTVLRPFSAVLSLGKACPNIWEEVCVACFDWICPRSLERCEKTLFRSGSLCFCSIP